MQKSPKAFTLIELMIVVAIIGILAAIAIPNFVKFQCRSKQSEAKSNLQNMYVLEETYRAQNDSYASVGDTGQINATTFVNNANAIGFALKGGKARYNYWAQASLSPTTGKPRYQSDAEGVLDLPGDKFYHGSRNVMVQGLNACESPNEIVSFATASTMVMDP